MADAEEAPLVIVKGMAGTAKTFYTLAVGLHAMLEHAVKERFATAPCLKLYQLCDTPAEAVEYLEHYNAAALDIKHLKNI